MRVGCDRRAYCFKTSSLHLPCARNPLRDGGAAFAAIRIDKIGGGNGRDVDPDVDAIEKRTRNARLIFRQAARTTRTLMPRLSGHATAAGIHRGDELNACRIRNAMIGARNHAFARFQRLTQRIQNPRRELWKFIQKQHTVMGK